MKKHYIFLALVLCSPKKNKEGKITPQPINTIDNNTLDRDDSSEKLVEDFLSIKNEIENRQNDLERLRDLRGKLQINLLNLEVETGCLRNKNINILEITISSNTNKNYTNQIHTEFEIKVGRPGKWMVYQAIENSIFSSGYEKKIFIYPKETTIGDIESIYIQKQTPDNQTYYIQSIEIKSNNLDIYKKNTSSFELSDSHPIWTDEHIFLNTTFLKAMQISKCD
jgi:hypothetical protein